MTTYWHGGSRICGEWILPGELIGTTRAAGDSVFVTTDKALAETYASTAEGAAWIYEVEPVGPVTPVPSLINRPTISYRCERARVVRRYTISNARRARLAGAVAASGR
jgi:hypothetical protein